eukprot:scpid68490/ scgid29417/ 
MVIVKVTWLSRQRNHTVTWRSPRRNVLGTSENVLERTCEIFGSDLESRSYQTANQLVEGVDLLTNALTPCSTTMGTQSRHMLVILLRGLAIWASFCHGGSTADKPRHEYCPPGLTSWCGWQSEKAGGAEYTHHDALPKAVFDEMKPVYVRLTDNALLLRCARSATQNANEALNGLVWGMCPKKSFCSRQTAETAAHLATAIFNDGYKTVANILSASGCAVSLSITAFPSRFDSDKAYHKRRKSSEEEKSARKRRRAIRKGFADRAQQEEGETYCAGGF